MKCKAMLVKMNDLILEEVRTKVVFEKDSKLFVGALFFEIDQTETIEEVLVEKVIEGETDNDLVNKCIEFYINNNQMSYESTKNTMLHWQFINGFTSTILNSRVGRG